MPTILKEKYSPDFMGRPPHMAAQDLNLWYRSRPILIKEAINLYFDVGLGGQIEIPPETSPEMAAMWLLNTQKRADVVIEQKDLWVIVELRFDATANALGRLLTYISLWNLNLFDLKPVRGMLVTNKKDTDIEFAAATMGIEFLVV